jgi:hypothetical protein
VNNPPVALLAHLICHRAELIEQAATTFAQVGISYGIIAAGARPDPLAPVQIARPSESCTSGRQSSRRRFSVSLNQYIALALAEKVGARGAADFFAERGKAGDADWAVQWLKERPE